MLSISDTEKKMIEKDDLKADDRPLWKRKLGERREQEGLEGRVDMSKT